MSSSAEPFAAVQTPSGSRANSIASSLSTAVASPGSSAETPIVLDAPASSRTGTKRSAAWDDCEVVSNEDKVQCLHCGAQLAYKASTGTSSMSRHVEVCKKKVRHNASQPVLSFAQKMPSSLRLRIHGLVSRNSTTSSRATPNA